MIGRDIVSHLRPWTETSHANLCRRLESLPGDRFSILLLPYCLAARERRLAFLQACKIWFGSSSLPGVATRSPLCVDTLFGHE
jgi:hypothetical protein